MQVNTRNAKTNALHYSLLQRVGSVLPAGKIGAGFTLIEMVIVLAIICITTLAAIAMYSSQVQASQRIDGINCLLSMSLAEERYRTVNTTYGTLAQVWGGVTASPEGYYTLAISSVTATGYTLTATAVGTQATDTANGVACSVLTLTVSAGTITKTPSACWPV